MVKGRPAAKEAPLLLLLMDGWLAGSVRASRVCGKRCPAHARTITRTRTRGESSAAAVTIPGP